MTSEALEQIRVIWEPVYTLTEKDKTFLRMPARSKFNGVNYGIYCGPLTAASHSVSYENDHPHGDPIDSLDFLCYLHDKFFTNVSSDDMFLRSIEVLNNDRMIGTKYNISGTRNLLTIMRRSFDIWRILRR